MKAAVIYDSNYGSTKEYAEWIIEPIVRTLRSEGYSIINTGCHTEVNPSMMVN